MKRNREVVITGAVRTAIGKFGGSLAGVSAQEMGGIVIAEALKRSGIEPARVDEVIMGHVLQAGLGMGTARQAAVRAGIPSGIPAMNINNICGSGLKAVNLAVSMIRAGDAEVVVAGGMENMSAAPYVMNKARWGYRMGHDQLVDTMILDALTDAFLGCHMGITAENVAEKYGITREEQDEFAAGSQQKAEKALSTHRFADEIVPVEVKVSKKETRIFQVDEFPRAGVTREGISHLSPAFKPNGTVTAANASGINDGAAAVVVMSGEKANELNIDPLARILSHASAGVDPSIMGTGPIDATTRALEKAGLGLGQIGLIESNEAFAAQALTVQKTLGMDPEIVNVNGGAIALGHPVGASGTRILVTLLYEMKKRGVKLGLATLCVGGGMGVTTVIEGF